jgi:hypothetical protein
VADPGTDTWRDERGVVCAITWSAGDVHYMAWPGVAVYRFDATGAPATAYPDPGAAPRDVHRVFLRAVLPAAHQQLGWQALHASAVLARRGVVLFCAPSGHGKSTLAYACRRHGMTQWADDSVVLRPTPEGAEALALPFDFSLRPESTRFFHPERGDDVLLLGRVERAAPARAPVAGICLLDRGDEGSAIAVTRVAPGDAFTRLLPHACTFSMAGAAARRRTFEDYLDLSTRVPVWDVRYPAGLSRLGEVVEAIGRTVDAGPGGGA